MSEEISVTENAQETQKLGEKIVSRSGILLRRRRYPKVFALFGELGSGKTTFVQGLAKGLGIKRRIISPTFIIIRKYQISSFQLPVSNFYHIDLYRIEKEDVDNLELLEILKDSSSIIAIEWAEKIRNLLPEKRWELHFEYLSENKRKITIKKLT